MIDYNTINKRFFNQKDQIDHYHDHYVNIEQAEQILFTKYVHADSSVLDIGCGVGRTTFFLKKITDHVIGMDYAENMIEVARKSDSSIDFRVMDATAMPLPDNSFDVTIFSYNGICCIHPEDKREKALSEICRVLKPNGIFIYSMLNEYTPHSLSSFVNYVVSKPVLGLSSNYKFHITRTGIMLLYENKVENEIEILRKMNFEYVEQHPSEAMHTSGKPAWTYFAFRKISGAR